MQCQIRWAWQDNSNDEQGFQLCDENGNILATIGPDSTEYLEDIPGSGTYTRQVRSFNANGNSSPSNTATVVCPALTVLRGSGAPDGRITRPSTDCDATTGFRPMLIYDPVQ
jgi:hypothetical protein